MVGGGVDRPLDCLGRGGRGGVRGGLPAAAGACLVVSPSVVFACFRATGSTELIPTTLDHPPPQAYRTGQKQRLFYSAKLHPELAAPHPNNPTSSSTSNTDPSSSPSASDASDAKSHNNNTNVKQEKELVLSYCANVLGDWPAPADYTPRFLRVVLKLGDGAGEGGEEGAAAAAAGRQGDL